ncbi:MAG: PepSY-associated TM helix domain-containing protein, partial [Planctomycetota bacterium]|nr:PepSY-associated TM helix domain-containing protein [Planctomycetota bacterium]
RVRLVFRRPGREVAVTVRRGEEEVGLVLREAGAVVRAEALHGLRRYRGAWPYRLWSGIADASGVALVLFALSGAWLAWSHDRRRTVGVLVPIGAFTAAVVAFLSCAP